jgi:hypothetical protein
VIIVRLKGGLGNQMFQYALGRALQHRRGDELRLDVTYLLGNSVFSWEVPREYSLDVFRIQPAFAYVPRLVCRAPRQRIWHPAGWTPLAEEALPRKQTFVHEAEFRFYPEVLDLAAPNLYLDGYWQSESYFAEAQEEIRRAFQFRAPLSPLGRELAQTIGNVNSVCVDVRRGDYVMVESSRNTQGFLGADYYRRGAEWIKANIQDPRLFVSSDDLSWCREHLKFDLPTVYLDDEYAGWKFGEKLHLMSLCRHFLISNSTFAWWAAWLSRNENKLVACPRRWFRTDLLSAKDLIPASWVTLWNVHEGSDAEDFDGEAL